MSDPFFGEIRQFPYNYPPYEWAYCNGATFAIGQNQVLYAVIGNTYGGNPGTTFSLPNLQAHAALHVGGMQNTGPGLTPRRLGWSVGEMMVTLSAAEMPAHKHTIEAGLPSVADLTTSPEGNILSSSMLDSSNYINAYNADSAPSAVMAPQSIASAGGNGQHENRQPYIAMAFCIALNGVYPPRP